MTTRAAQPQTPTNNQNDRETTAINNVDMIPSAPDGEVRAIAQAVSSSPTRRQIHWSVVLALVALFILLLGGTPIYMYGVFDTLSNFRWQAVFFCVSLAVYQQYRGRRSWACILMTLSLVAAMPLVSLYFPSSQPAAGNSRLRVLTLNVLAANRNYSRVVQLIRDTDADIVNLVEYDPVWESELNDVMRSYPWHVGPVQGKIVFSKFPLKPFELNHPFFGAVKYLSAAATLEVDGQLVLIVNTHATSPTTLPRLLERDAQLNLLATSFSYLPKRYHVVLVGDFNATTSCRSLRSMMATSGLRDTRQGFGIQSSWPTLFWPLAICIDHAFVSRNVHVHDRKTGPNVGSDHLPVILELSFNKQPTLKRDPKQNNP